VELLLGCAPQAAALADELLAARAVACSGRGYTYTTALELALKLQEACLLPAHGFSQADLLHGPIAAIGMTSPVIICAPSDGPVTGQMLTLAGQVRERGGRVYCIGGPARLAAACTSSLPGPQLTEALTPLALAVPGQLLTEALARGLGYDPDLPSGLTKVTQT
jgi:glucosamine--fructose-6-phosphate aminotransferase (isomerizing)